MNDEYQWQQLGSVVNRVLVQAKSQAIKSGSVSKVASLGFLDTTKDMPLKPIQMELPFGIHTKEPVQQFGKAAAPRGLRLM